MEKISFLLWNEMFSSEISSYEKCHACLKLSYMASQTLKLNANFNIIVISQKLFISCTFKVEKLSLCYLYWIICTLNPSFEKTFIILFAKTLFTLDFRWLAILFSVRLHCINFEKKMNHDHQRDLLDSNPLKKLEALRMAVLWWKQNTKTLNRYFYLLEAKYVTESIATSKNLSDDHSREKLCKFEDAFKLQIPALVVSDVSYFGNILFCASKGKSH